MFTIDENEIMSPDDLHEMYTNWLIDHYKFIIILDKEEKRVVEYIRENSEKIYLYTIEQDKNEYTLREFETMVMEKYKDEFI